MTTRSPQPRWSREEIRAARLAPLAPLLTKQGLHLVLQEAGNFLLPAYPGLIIKDRSPAEHNRPNPSLNTTKQPPAS